MKYEKPDLEEMELILEGSFLVSRTDGNTGFDKDPEEGEFDPD